MVKWRTSKRHGNETFLGAKQAFESHRGWFAINGQKLVGDCAGTPFARDRSCSEDATAASTVQTGQNWWPLRTASLLLTDCIMTSYQPHDVRPVRDVHSRESWKRC